MVLVMKNQEEKEEEYRWRRRNRKKIWRIRKPEEKQPIAISMYNLFWSKYVTLLMLHFMFNFSLLAQAG